MRQGSDASDISSKTAKRNSENLESSRSKKYSLTPFGKQDVCQGILDANTKDELQEKLNASREILETEETRVTGRKVPLYWKYVNSHKDMMEKCMIGNARK